MITLDEWNEKAKEGRRFYFADFSEVHGFDVKRAYFGVGALRWADSWKYERSKPHILLLDWSKQKFKSMPAEFCFFSKKEAEVALEEQQLEQKRRNISWARCEVEQARAKVRRAEEEYDLALKRKWK